MAMAANTSAEYLAKTMSKVNLIAGQLLDGLRYGQQLQGV